MHGLVMFAGGGICRLCLALFQLVRCLREHGATHRQGRGNDHRRGGWLRPRRRRAGRVDRCSVGGDRARLSLGFLRTQDHVRAWLPCALDHWLAGWLTSMACARSTVWSTSLGAGSYSLDGLHVSFPEQSIDTVRVGSTAQAATGSTLFEGWQKVVFHFGYSVGAGAVRVAASSTLETVAGKAVSVVSESVSVAAGRSLDIATGAGGCLRCLLRPP
jgi:hypothetical protein